MNLLRSFRRPAAPVRAEMDNIIGFNLYPSGRVEAVKTGSGWYGSGMGEGFGAGAFSETAIGVNTALSQSVFGWAAAYSVSTWVYRCIEIRKSAVHRMPWSIIDRKTKQRLPNHPLEIALKRNHQKVFKKIEQSQLLFGETFVEFAVNPYGYRSDLFWLNNLGMAVLIGAGAIIGYSYTAMQGGHGRNFSPDQVAFMKTDNPFNDLRGMSPTEVIMDEVGIDKDVARVVRAYYANDTRVGLLFIPKTQLLPGDSERFLDEWLKQNKGVNRAGKPNLMPFDMTVERVQEPATLDDVDLRSSTRREIAAAYGVPLSLAGAWDDANYQSLPEQRKSFYEETIIPECDNIADWLNEDVMPVFDDSGDALFQYDYMTILALTEDAQKKNDIYSNRLVSGLITRAEARAALGHPVRDVDDVYYIPTGATVVPANEEALVTPTANQVESTPTQQEHPVKPEPRPSGPPELPAPKPPPKQLPAPQAQPPAPAHKNAPQATAADELAAWEKKALNSNAVKAATFVCYVLPVEAQTAIRSALIAAGRNATKAQIRAVFATAKSDFTKVGQRIARPPVETLDYWRHYDALEGVVGSTFDDYMAQALGHLLADFADAPTDLEIQAALDFAHPAFMSALSGTDEQPGPLVKLVAAGMGAGHEALVHHSAANPQRPVSAKALEMDWELLSREAIDAAREYIGQLIKNVDATTLSQVRELTAKWVESGEPLDSLKEKLAQLFKDPVRASAIAETEAGNAYVQGAAKRYERAGVKKIKLSHLNDGRVCDTCKPLEGTVVLLAEGWQAKTGRKWPPFHTRCRHWIIPAEAD